MNRFEAAGRKYRDLWDDDFFEACRHDRYVRWPTRDLLAWINNNVLAAVQEVIQRPRFRDFATWPQRVLELGATSPERHAIDAVDQALVREGRALVALMRSKVLRKQLELDDVPQLGFDERNVAIPPGWVPLRGCKTGPVLDLLLLRGQVQGIADRGWKDLVCSQDYFGPFAGLNGDPAARPRVQEASLMTAFNPELLAGDSITRSMLQRVEVRLRSLDGFRGHIYEAIRASKRPFAKLQDAEREAWDQLQLARDSLTVLCRHTNDSALRESCIILTKVYAEFHCQPDISWLGVEGWVRNKGLLHCAVTSRRDVTTTDRIATALEDVKHLYRESSPEQASMDVAIANGVLVLVQSSRTAYWQTKEIQADWHTHAKPWELLLTLAKKSFTRTPVGERDLYLDGVARSTLPNRWRHLKALLPATLAVKVKPSSKAYLLDLSRNQVQIF